MKRILFISILLCTHNATYTDFDSYYPNIHDSEPRAVISLYKPGTAIAKGLASMLTYDLIISILTGYFYAHKQEYPYLSAFFTALWSADFITFTAHHYGKDEITNSLLKTIIDHPFLTGLLVSGYINPQLIDTHPYISLGIGGYLTYSVAENILE